MKRVYRIGGGVMDTKPAGQNMHDGTLEIYIPPMDTSKYVLGNPIRMQIQTAMLTNIL